MHVTQRLPIILRCVSVLQGSYSDDQTRVDGVAWLMVAVHVRNNISDVSVAEVRGCPLYHLNIQCYSDVLEELTTMAFIQTYPKYP